MIKCRVAELAEERGLSIKKLAAIAQVDYNTIYRLKTGKQQGISFPVLERLCKALECSRDDLLAVVEDSNQEDR